MTMNRNHIKPAIFVFAYALIVGLTYPFAAHAVGIGNDNPPGFGGGVQVQGQDQKQAQGQAQAQIVSNRISNESRASAKNYVNVAPVEVSTSLSTAPVSVSYNEAQQPASTRNEQVGTVNVRTVPNVFAGNVYPTAPCMGSSSVGAAALGWGASVGTSWADHECGKRETARSFQNLGLTADAIAVLCTSEYAAAAPVCQPK
jgi:hypothetical protein